MGWLTLLPKIVYLVADLVWKIINLIKKGAKGGD